jgi:hypothetical protein
MATPGADSSGGDWYRSHLAGEGEKDTVWRHGAPPTYDVVNALFEAGRTPVELLRFEFSHMRSMSRLV